MAIFGKNESQGQVSAPDRAAAVPAAAAETVVGSKARFVGELTGDEDIAIHGRFEGNVSSGRRVTVAGSGEVKGDVHGRSVVVAGRVEGQIRADERAELLATAAVKGNVQAPKVVIAEGAQLQGSVAMAAPEAPAEKGAKE